MAIAKLRTRRTIVDGIVPGCGCHWWVWLEIDGDKRTLHIGPCCADCGKRAIDIVQQVFGDVPPVVYERD